MLVENGCLVDIKAEDVPKLLNEPKNFWYGITSVGSAVFGNPRVAPKTFVIPSSVERVESDAISGVPSENVVIGESVKYVNAMAFTNNQNLKVVVLPDNFRCKADPDAPGFFGLMHTCPNIKYIFTSDNMARKYLTAQFEGWIGPKFYQRKVVDLSMFPEKFLDLPDEVFSDAETAQAIFDKAMNGVYEAVKREEEDASEIMDYILEKWTKIIDANSNWGRSTERQI